MYPIKHDQLILEELDIYKKMDEIFDLSYTNNEIGYWKTPYSIAAEMGVKGITQRHTRIIVKLIKMMGNPKIIKRINGSTWYYMKKKH